MVDRSARIETALSDLIDAWEALPQGHHSPGAVERWLRHHMKPAVDAGRGAIGRTSLSALQEQQP